MVELMNGNGLQAGGYFNALAAVAIESGAEATALQTLARVPGDPSKKTIVAIRSILLAIGGARGATRPTSGVEFLRVASMMRIIP